MKRTFTPTIITGRGQFKLAYDTLYAWLPSARAQQMHLEGQILTTVAIHRDRPVGMGDNLSPESRTTT